MTSHPNRSKAAPNSLRAQMQKAGYKAHKVLCQDPNGGLKLVDGWTITKPGQDKPRPGEIMGGAATREEAWLAAESRFF